MELRPYQVTAIHKIRKAISSGKKSIMVQSPTGSGKGVMLSHIINSANEKGSTVLFLVHRTEILFQVSASMDHYGIVHGIIKSGEEANYTHPVQLASFQTIHRRMDWFVKEFDVVIIDEAHHCTAKTYMDVVTAFRKNIIIGFSATPTRKNGIGLGNMFDALIQVETIKNLTEAGYLAPVRYYAPITPNLSGVKLQAGDYNEKQLEPVMLEEGLVSGIVEKWLQFGEGRKTVVFATGVKHSIAITERFEKSGIVAEHLDGKTLPELRKRIIAAFKAGDIQVIVNCQVLTEGVDVPDISCVILARPTKSLAMFMQMVGRGMRTIKGKSDMILLDHAGCVYEHGFVEEISEWTLSTKNIMKNKKEEERKENNTRPIECPVCSLMYTKQLKCPVCGTIPEAKQFGKEVEYIDGELGLICMKSRQAKTVPVTMEEKQQFYSELVTYCRTKNFSHGWISHKYRSRFNVWPKGMMDKPMPVTENLTNWLKHMAIKSAKSKKA